MQLKFMKMHGTGNDFVFLDDRDGKIKQHISYSELARKLCSRHFSIGADGIILILNPDDADHDMKFRIYNCDGSQAQMCGNGMRCFAKILYEENILTQRKIRVDTKAGTVIPEVLPDADGRVEKIRVNMGEPDFLCSRIPFNTGRNKAFDYPLRACGLEFAVNAVSMGNPHAVIFVDNVNEFDLEKIGPAIENHEKFPEKTNVEIVEVINTFELRMRVWERGAGITLACGTGACASLAAAAATGRAGRHALIHLDGGDLEIAWDEKTNHIFKTGPADFVFKGTITI